MKTVYFQKRSELTGMMKSEQDNGLTCYRVRTNCDCKKLIDPLIHPRRANQRNGVLVIQDNQVIAKYVRCRTCYAIQNLTAQNCAELSP